MTTHKLLELCSQILHEASEAVAKSQKSAQLGSSISGRSPYATISEMDSAYRKRFEDAVDALQVVYERLLREPGFNTGNDLMCTLNLIISELWIYAKKGLPHD